MATFDEDEAEMLENLNYLDYINRMERRSRRIISPRRNDLEQLDDYDFLCRYRLPKDSVRNLLERIGHNLVSTSSRNYAMSPMEQLLLALRFYATGTFQLVVGDLNDLSQSSACRAINRVSFLIAQISADYIQLPKTESERKQISQDFFHLSGFPCVYGAIDCTHIPIQSPGGETAELFRNRKGYFSINVQTVSDSHLKIRNIVARWPGSSHDSTIFANSHLCAMFQAGDIPSKYHLLGDSGYGCKAYLLTPILNPESDQEKRYNRCHIKARNTVERQYGLWKRRFPCLSVGLRCNLQNAMAVIVATAVLHNIAISDGNMTVPTEFDISMNEDVPVPVVRGQNAAGFAKRNALIADFFSI